MKSKITIPSSTKLVIAFGVHDSNLRLLERVLKIKLLPMEDMVVLEGDESNIAIARNVLQNLFSLSRSNIPISHTEIEILIEKCSIFGDFVPSKINSEGLMVSRSGSRSHPRSSNQLEYINKILNSDMVFAIGPAGTGKTYNAVSAGLHLLITGAIKRLILTRPVIEAGENLGFLPGTLEEKIDPYLRPLYDAINDMLSPDEIKFYTSTNVIELAPLAYMRGRTLSNALVILDEAQNTTPTQMKMFLTRLGENSRMVITGDITQIDLPGNKESGLRQASHLFKDVPGIEFVYFTQADVVRHGLVRKIIEIYEAQDNKA